MFPNMFSLPRGEYATAYGAELRSCFLPSSAVLSPRSARPKFISSAPTNKASLIINGITLHKFVMKMKTAKSVNKLQIYDYICVDEISMVKEIFYKV